VPPSPGKLPSIHYDATGLKGCSIRRGATTSMATRGGATTSETKRTNTINLM
jgi:hypothetical protein